MTICLTACGAEIFGQSTFNKMNLYFLSGLGADKRVFSKLELVIIISSTPTGVPISKFYQGLSKFLLLSPFAGPILKSANSITYKYFGADTPELKTLLKSILHDTDTKFMKWALVRMGSWKRKDKARNLYHIHGTNDKLISIKLVNPDVTIDGAGHLMVYAQAKQISDILNKKLSDSWATTPNR